jgi:hypothetical protein
MKEGRARRRVLVVANQVAKRRRVPAVAQTAVRDQASLMVIITPIHQHRGGDDEGELTRGKKLWVLKRYCNW